ncbi:MAG: Gx transporter family protein [Synergistaceae bacterium]|jgi:heptaprenyl diphosphate synthase|nr:Gx transporter family protein [Synergistaceae bacterium]
MKKYTAREITSLALMLSMIMVLSAIEGMFPALPFHMRFGLSNVVTMYALFFMGGRPAFILAALKSLSVFLARGPIAGIMSASGGIVSLISIAAVAAFSSGASYLFLSVTGALVHNMAQLAAASFIVSTNLVPVYLPILAAAAIPAGILTAALLRAVMPLFKAISPEKARLQRT